MMEKRYLQSTQFVRNATSEAEIRKFQQIARLFRKYSDQYDVDYLLMAAQGFQESGLDQSVKSRVGAVGVMQVMPATGKELGRRRHPATRAQHPRGREIHALDDGPLLQRRADGPAQQGAVRLRLLQRRPRAHPQLRKEAEKRGLDPNVWFGNVEQIASERIGRETVTYVSNIYKYWVAYRLVLDQKARREAAKKSLEPASDQPPR